MTVNRLRLVGIVMLIAGLRCSAVAASWTGDAWIGSVLVFFAVILSSGLAITFYPASVSRLLQSRERRVLIQYVSGVVLLGIGLGALNQAFSSESQAARWDLPVALFGLVAWALGAWLALIPFYAAQTSDFAMLRGPRDSSESPEEMRERVVERSKSRQLIFLVIWVILFGCLISAELGR